MTGDPNRWFDPSAFVLQPAGTLGTVRRNELIGPNLRTVDLALTKHVPWTRIGAGGRVDFRVEVFNLPNHPIWNQPGATLRTPTFGVITSTRMDSRQIQIGMKVVF